MAALALSLCLFSADDVTPSRRAEIKRYFAVELKRDKSKVDESVAKTAKRFSVSEDAVRKIVGNLADPPRVKADRQPQYIEVAHDRFEKRTWARLIFKESDTRYVMMAFAIRDDKRTPDTVFAIGFGDSRPLGNPSLAKNHRVVFLVDGEKIECDQERYDYQISGSTVLDTVAAALSEDGAGAISKAKKLECRVGHHEFEFSPEAVDGIRAICDVRLDPSKYGRLRSLSESDDYATAFTIKEFLAKMKPKPSPP